MISIHATKKLYAELPDNIKHITTAAAGNPLSDWHANLITLQEHDCILMVHDATRFPLVITSLMEDDFKNLQWHFEDTLMNTLLKINANQEQLDKAAQYLASCQFDTQCNRSVQGTMNRMAGNFERMLANNGLLLQDVNSYKVGAWLSDFPCTIKGQKDCIWPGNAFLELLSHSG